MTYPVPNEYGVYPKDTAEVIEYRGKKSVASIRLLKIEAGWLAAGEFTHYTGSYFSVGGPLMLPAYESREVALKTEAEQIAKYQSSVIDGYSSVTTETQRDEARSIQKWARAIAESGKGPAVQVGLFS